MIANSASPIQDVARAFGLHPATIYAVARRRGQGAAQWENLSKIREPEEPSGGLWVAEPCRVIREIPLTEGS